MSTPDYSARHETRSSPDPWSPQPDESSGARPSRHARDERGSPYYRDLDAERSSPYYRDLGEDRETRDFFYDDVPYGRDALFDEPSPRGIVRHLLSAFFCLVLTPVGIAAMTYGTERYWQLTLDQAGAERDVRGLAAIGAGACILVIVAWLAALSPAGPLLSGLIWGLVPAGIYLAYPHDTTREVSDLLVLPDFALSGAVTWLENAAFLMVGALLVGAGLAATRRRSTT